MNTSTDVTPPPAEVQPPPRKPRHRVRKTLLVLGGAFTALIVILVIIAVATSKPNTIKPAATPSTTYSTQMTAQPYSTVEYLLAAMTANGATCSNQTLKYNGVVPGEVNPFVDCTAVSGSDTVVVIFTDHASAIAYANGMLGIGQTTSSPTAEVVGPNWTVNTVPAFAPKVIKAVGGQLITAPSSPATSAPATPTPSPTSAPATSAPATPKPTTATTTAPSMTVAQQQAVSAAQGYLSLGSGFSEQGSV